MHLKNIKSFVSFKYIHKPIHTQYKTFNTKQNFNMPLVDPVTNSAGGDKTTEWQNKLVGKKIGESSDAVVWLSPSQRLNYVANASRRPLQRQNYRRRPESSLQAWWLPRTSERTGMPPGMDSTKFRELTLLPRLNVHVGDDGTVTHVNHG
jgi:hypothetical protein